MPTPLSCLGLLCAAITLTQNLVGSQGFEPRMPEATDLQSVVVTNATRYPLFGSALENRTLLASD